MLAMNIRRVFCAGAFLGAILSSVTLSAADDSQLRRVWSASGISVRERAEAVNRAFTNGTSIRTVVAVLGTNYMVLRPFSSVWIGPGPEPRKTCSLFYQFGDDEVVIGTSADIAGDPLTGQFTGAGYGVPVANLTKPTNGIATGQQGTAPKASEPSSSGTNLPPSGAGSRR
jgi:hypothetical protein